jgi:hypothetical protein
MHQKTVLYFFWDGKQYMELALSLLSAFGRLLVIVHLSDLGHSAVFQHACRCTCAHIDTHTHTQNIYIYIYIYTYNSEFIKQKMYVTVQCVFGRSVLSRASMALLEEAESILFITVKQLINSKMTVLNCDYNYSFFCYHHHHHHHHQLHSLDPIGPFWLINLVWPNLHWSSKTSVSLWMALPSLFKYSLIFISS